MINILVAADITRDDNNYVCEGKERGDTQLEKSKQMQMVSNLDEVLDVKKRCHISC